ncbi:hypothetical protein P3T27_007595 [Kitasatospora sp. MAA19]|nr:hypothetical protein [Kitasatospora sp. MAA19]
MAELDGDCLKGWPAGMQLIVRKEGPHPGVQWRFTDADGMRLTCLATNPRTCRSPYSNCVTGRRPEPRTAFAPPAQPACAASPPRHRAEPDLAVEPGAHPTRQPGHRQAHHQSDKPKRPAS